MELANIKHMCLPDYEHSYAEIELQSTYEKINMEIK